MSELRREIIFPNKQIFLFVCIATFTFLFLKSFTLLQGIYIPIIISYFLAFLLNPIIEKAETRGFGRVGPTIITLTIFFVFVLFLAGILMPHLITQTRQLAEKLPFLGQTVAGWLTPYSMEYLGYDLLTEWERFVVNLVPHVSNIPGGKFVVNFFNGTLRAIGTLVTVLMVPILAFYMLKDYHSINKALMQLVPRRFLSHVEEVTDRLSIILGGLIRGQVLVCTLLAAFYSISLMALGVEMGFALGIIGGVLNLVPFIGPLVAMLLTILLTLISGGTLTLYAAILGVFVLANLLDNTLLTPKIVGRQMGISPLTIILALLAGGELLGFLGMLLALPVTAMVKVFGGYLSERYYESEYYK